MYITLYCRCILPLQCLNIKLNTNNHKLSIAFVKLLQGGTHLVTCQDKSIKIHLWFASWKCSPVNKTRSLRSLFHILHKSFDNVFHKCFALVCQAADDWRRRCLPIRGNHKAGRILCADFGFCYFFLIKESEKCDSFKYQQQTDSLNRLSQGVPWF